MASLGAQRLPCRLGLESRLRLLHVSCLLVSPGAGSSHMWPTQSSTHLWRHPSLSETSQLRCPPWLDMKTPCSRDLCPVTPLGFELPFCIGGHLRANKGSLLKDENILLATFWLCDLEEMPYLSRPSSFCEGLGFGQRL